MIHARIFSRLLFAVLMLTADACFKDSTENFVDEELAIQDAALGEQEADDVLDVVYQAEFLQHTHPGVTILINTCATVSTDTINKVMTIDFGLNVAGCVAFYNRVRKGKIISTYEGNIGDTLSRRTVTFDHYSVSNKSVTGTVDLGNFTINALGQIVADRTMTDLAVTFGDGSGVTFNGTESKTWRTGMADTLLYNNTYILTGEVNGVTHSGRSFTQRIDLPVLINFYCAFQNGFARTQGQVDLIHLDGYPDRTRLANYGDSTCNKSVTISTFRRTYGVTAN